ncbi:TATA box-binding protein-like 1 isoform X3 [Nerophis ophidion]|uniref:TATA box-binding protein-like 1 isoform X3 n=1 Tax=Nerophis ophidion TaxID=159077 RepID=UPI002ADF0981|nr:TATA box-binding protein-like 1 isoform X3 [Nerophis ophidion]
MGCRGLEWTAWADMCSWTASKSGSDTGQQVGKKGGERGTKKDKKSGPGRVWKDMLLISRYSVKGSQGVLETISAGSGRMCGSQSTAPATQRAQPKKEGVAQQGRPATGTPELGPPCRPKGPATGRRQARPADDKAWERQGTISPQASEGPKPTRVERRDAAS